MDSGTGGSARATPTVSCFACGNPWAPGTGRGIDAKSTGTQRSSARPSSSKHEAMTLTGFSTNTRAIGERMDRLTTARLPSMMCSDSCSSKVGFTPTRIPWAVRQHLTIDANRLMGR